VEHTARSFSNSASQRTSKQGRQASKHVVGNWLGWLLAGKSDSNKTVTSSIVLMRAWLDLYLLFLYFFFIFPL
jgi:hypothetical protein